MRALFFILVLAAGLGLIFGYPLVAERFAASEIGALGVFDKDSGFVPATLNLDTSAGPATVAVEIATTAKLEPQVGASVLTLTVTAEGRTVFAKALDFAGASARATSPQAAEFTYSQEAGEIPAAGLADYLFTVGEGDARAVSLSSVRVIVSQRSAGLGDRATPIGIAIAALGFFGLVGSFRRRPANPNSSPPPPKWGRG